MKILVTGATGFVGSHVVRRLLGAGHRIRVLRRESSSIKMLAGLSIETAIGDVTDRHSVYDAVSGCDGVFHVAGHVSFWSRQHALQTAIHVGGTRNVVEACLEHKIRRLVHTSSIAAIGYAPEGRLGDETLNYNWWPYRVNYNNSKHLAEEEVRAGIRRGLDAVIVNPAIIFGPGDLNLNAGAMVFQAARRRLIAIPDGGGCVCDVEDVARGHLLAFEKGRAGERYILGGDNYSWKDLFTLITQVVGVPPPKKRLPSFVLKSMGYLAELQAKATHKEPVITPEAARVTLVPCYYSSDKAVRELGYTVSPFRETVRKTYEWYVANGYLKLR
jgi:dihydroflavonol-4-reductase